MNGTRSGRQIYCVVSDKYGNSVKSDTVTLSMESLYIMTQPQCTEGVVDEDASFTIKVAGGTAPYSYQWQYYDTELAEYGWQNITDEYAEYYGAYKETLYLTPVTEFDVNGRCSYRCVVTDANGTCVISDVVRVTRNS